MLPANRMAKLGISEQVHAYVTQTYSQSKLVGFRFHLPDENKCYFQCIPLEHSVNPELINALINVSENRKGNQ